MGLVKEMMIECEERGYGRSNKYVCSDCVGNKYLKQFVIDSSYSCKLCDFCENEGICISVGDLCGKIMNAISFEYEKAVGVMGWNSKEGGYIGAETYDIYDLLEDLNYDMLLEQKVLEEIYYIVDCDTWCQINPYDLRECVKNSYMWKRFSDMVKYETRYVFFRMPEYDKDNNEPNFLILNRIAGFVCNLNLIKRLPKGSSFYRGRLDSYINESDLCSPNLNFAKSNRMSAEGISVFYGADNEDTVVSEIGNKKQSITVALFESQREFVILNLKDNCVIPNLFDTKNGHLREAAKFLNEFSNDLAKQIEKMQQIEYIPSQVVAEYFRYLYSDKGEAIDGISYKSSKKEGGICYVLFFDHDRCLKGDVLKLKKRWEVNKWSFYNILVVVSKYFGKIITRLKRYEYYKDKISSFK